MNFASDNTGPVAPEIMDALAAANRDYEMPYAADAAMERVRGLVRDLFEAPDAEVFLVATGTACNALILGCLGDPWSAIFAHEKSHVAEDECGAPEFFSFGAKVREVPGPGGKMDPGALRRMIGQHHADVHSVERGPVSITQVTEAGTVHTLEELAERTGVARDFGLRTHMDGARFSNAVAALGCAPAEMTWKLGIDAVSFGGTKNGCMGVEAAVFFNPGDAANFPRRRMRAGHLFSKHRYLSAQMEAYLSNGLWRRLAETANARMARLAAGLRTLDGVDFTHDADANMAFVEMPRAMHRRAFDAGAKYYLMDHDATMEGDPDEPIPCRLICDFRRTEEEVDRFLDALRG